jgi:hypothetical protein
MLVLPPGLEAGRLIFAAKLKILFICSGVFNLSSAVLWYNVGDLNLKEGMRQSSNGGIK